MSQTELIVRMDRIVCAARVMRWVRENMPGDDLGQQASALTTMELNAALLALDEAFPDGIAFDALAALKELADRDGVKIAGVN